jgi:GntR family transcriptional regulator
VPVPDLADPRPPYLQIADDLRKQIRDGRYQPGDRLPSNKAMAGEYNTSTETVRRALRVLTDDGLIGAHSTLGTFVLKLPSEPGPSPEITRLESALQEAEARLTGEIARLREELEYLEARVMALEGPAEAGERSPSDRPSARHTSR